MKAILPEPIRNLPEADIPLDGIRAYLSQASDHQLIFMQFDKDVDLAEHSYAVQAGFVLCVGAGNADAAILLPKPIKYHISSRIRVKG